jgi:hypothetical protein
MVFFLQNNDFQLLQFTDMKKPMQQHRQDITIHSIQNHQLIIALRQCDSQPDLIRLPSKGFAFLHFGNGPFHMINAVRKLSNHITDDNCASIF